MAEEIKKRGRGRPKGTGGNKRPDRSVQTEPGDNRKYIEHSLRMWDWPTPDMQEPEEVKARVIQYFELCAKDDMKPSVAGLALAFGIDRRRLWEIVAGVTEGHSVTKNVAPGTRDYLKKAYGILNTQIENYAQNGKINPVTAIFLMKNHFGYRDQQEVVVTPNGALGDQVPEDELAKKYLDDVSVVSSYDPEE